MGLIALSLSGVVPGLFVGKRPGLESWGAFFSFGADVLLSVTYNRPVQAAHPYSFRTCRPYEKHPPTGDVSEQHLGRQNAAPVALERMRRRDIRLDEATPGARQSATGIKSL